MGTWPSLFNQGEPQKGLWEQKNSCFSPLGLNLKQCDFGASQPSGHCKGRHWNSWGNHSEPVNEHWCHVWRPSNWWASLICMDVFFPCHQATNYIQSWHYKSGESIWSHRGRAQPYKTAPILMPFSSPGCYLCFRLTGYKLEFPMMPSSGSNDWLEWFTKLKGIFTCIYQFIIKGHNSVTVRWKKCTGQSVYVGRALSFHSLSKCTALPAPPQIHWPRSSPNHPVEFLWRLHYTGIWLNYIGL